MLSYEQYFYRQGKNVIAGIDEVGRGPLAGPVVAAAVVLPRDFSLCGINDSKKLTHVQRVALCDKLLLFSGVHVGIGIVSAQIIDEINILQATKVAMVQAVLNLPVTPDHLLIDALVLDSLTLSQTKIIKGDSLSLSIASASIVAKVVRDTIMEEYDRSEGNYGFARHKGYGTRKHLDALKQFGLSPIHRKSFSPIQALCREEVAR